MEGEGAVEEGIPGHSASAEWARRLQEFLRDRGYRFEAEGEATRIHLGDLQVEVTQDGDKFQLVFSVPLPGRASAEEVEPSIRAYETAMKLLLFVGEGEPTYSVDDSLPGYPVLHITVSFSSPESLADRLMSALSQEELRRLAEDEKLE
ncbi:MAG: hypothetical protein ABWW70_04385 [Thermoproteota archaeon]